PDARPPSRAAPGRARAAAAARGRSSLGAGRRHRRLEAVLGCCHDRVLVARVEVTENAETGVGSEHPLDALRHFVGAVRDDAHDRDPRRRELEPPLKESIPGKLFQQRHVYDGDVKLITRERSPAEGPDAATEERPDIGRDKARVCESVGYTRLMSLPSEVVAI